MKRILVVYNPRSSQFARVSREVLEPLRRREGAMVGKFEVAATNVDENAKKLAKVLEDEDLVIAAGGDATALIAVNGILESGKEARLAVLPYGNFNDLARTLGDLKLEEILGSAGVVEKSGETAGKLGKISGKVREKKFYPLEIFVDGKFFRCASCYTTIGMTAEAVEIFDRPKVRRSLKKKSGREIGSYWFLMNWYFKNRRKKEFLPEFSLNGVLQRKKTSDYAAVNGKYMARVMKGGEEFLSPRVFRSYTERTVKFWPLMRLMIQSIFRRVPGGETREDALKFIEPATVEIQTEGEYRKFSKISEIKIRKAEKWLKVVMK